MTIPLALIESDSWSSIRNKIEIERARKMEGLLHTTPEGLRGEQQFIAALDWVLEQARPNQETDEEPIYEC